MQSDRKSMPSIHTAKFGLLPEAEETRLDNGIPFFNIRMGFEDLLRLDFVFEAGQAYESMPLQASTTNMMLLEGSKNRTAREMNSLLDFYGTFPNLLTEKDTAGFSIIFLARHLEKIAELCCEILFEPVFPGKEFRILLNNRLQRYLVNREKVQVIAREMFFESIFGADHPYGRRIHIKDFDNIAVTHLQQFHLARYGSGNMAIIASGRSDDSLPDILNRAFGYLKPELSDPQTEMMPLILEPGSVKKSFRKEGAIQSAIRIGKATINKTHPDYHGLKVVNTILGGYFGSRLMKNLREERGYTYGVHSAVTSLRHSGFISVSAEVGAEHTLAAINEIHNEIYRLQNEPVGKEELDTVRGYMMGELIRLFDGPFATADTFRSAWEFGLGNDYYRNFENTIKTITPDEIIHLAGTYYIIEGFHEIIAGPE